MYLLLCYFKRGRFPVLKLLTPAEGKKHWRLYEPDNKLPRCVSVPTFIFRV